MTSPALDLLGSRRWLAGVTIGLAASALIGTQVHPTLAHADTNPAATTFRSSPSVVTSAAAPVAMVAEAAVGEADARPVATRPAAAHPAAAHPAAAHPAAAHPAAPAKAAKAAHLASTASSDVCSGSGWQVQRGQHALATLRDTGQRSGVTVTFQGARSGYLGLTYPAQHHVDVFVRSCASESAALLRHVVSHEMGHAYDAAHMTSSLRAAYMSMRGIPAGTPWFGCSYCTDFNTPAGDFAETYSQWQRSASDSRTQIAPMPNATQLAAIAAAFFQG